VVDIGPTFEAKLACVALSGDESAAIDEYTKVALETRDHAIGQKYGLEYAEEFHYVGPDTAMEEYFSRRAVRI
jgi:hypothetical protein